MFRLTSVASVPLCGLYTCLVSNFIFILVVRILYFYRKNIIFAWPDNLNPYMPFSFEGLSPPIDDIWHLILGLIVYLCFLILEREVFFGFLGGKYCSANSQELVMRGIVSCVSLLLAIASDAHTHTPCLDGSVQMQLLYNIFLVSIGFSL